MSRPVAISIVSFSLVALPSLVARPDAQAPSVDALVERTAAYVAGYETQLTAVLATEVTTQRILAEYPRDDRIPLVRKTQSEMFFAFLPASHQWMAIRDVKSVDGTEVADRPDLATELRTLPVSTVGQAFKSYNSRYNIGRAFRNFNEPTLALTVFNDHYRPRIAFDRRKVEHKDGITLAVLAFHERGQDTIIRDLLLRPVVSSGEFTVEADTGRVRKTTLTTTIGDLHVQLETTYGHDDKLELWLPTKFREQYENGVQVGRRPFTSGGSYERILCDSSYSDFRRFETASQLIIR